MVTRFTPRETDGYESGKMYPEQDDQDPSDPPHCLHVFMEKTADIGGPNAEEDEDAGESGDKEKGVDYDLPANLVGRVLGLHHGK